MCLLGVSSVSVLCGFCKMSSWQGLVIGKSCAVRVVQPVTLCPLSFEGTSSLMEEQIFKNYLKICISSGHVKGRLLVRDLARRGEKEKGCKAKDTEGSARGQESRESRMECQKGVRMIEKRHGYSLWHQGNGGHRSGTPREISPAGPPIPVLC